MAQRASWPGRGDAAATAFEQSVSDRILRPGAELLLRHVPIEARQKVLEVGCATGALTAMLAGATDASVQLMAVEPNLTLLDRARARAASHPERKIFFKSDPLTKLKFASDVFDVCLSNFTLVESAGRDAILAETVRVLRPKGHLAVTGLVRGSFEEALDLYDEVCVKYDLHAHLQTFGALLGRVPDAQTLREMFADHGVRAERFEEQTIEITFRNGREFVQDPLFGFGIFGLLHAAAGRAPQNQRIGHHLATAIDAYFHGSDFRLTVQTAALFGVKLEAVEVGEDAIEAAEATDPEAELP